MTDQHAATATPFPGAPDRAGALSEAIYRIEEAMVGLDTERQACPCCGVTAYRDFEAYRQHAELGGALTKLRRIKAAWDRPAEVLSPGAPVR